MVFESNYYDEDFIEVLFSVIVFGKNKKQVEEVKTSSRRKKQVEPDSEYGFKLASK